MYESEGAELMEMCTKSDGLYEFYSNIQQPVRTRGKKSKYPKIVRTYFMEAP